ncbi:MAG: amidohydrolase [Methanobrevibacter sp.]|jgi:predicted amidohydrolase YtcJ|nr:amidohydrolase [Methanobrevibacter sp.]
MKADILICSNAIFDSVSNQPFKGFIALSHNKIIKVGKGSYDEFIGENTKIFNLGDKLVMSGLIDSHIHFFMGAITSSKYIINTLINAFSEEECCEMVHDFAIKHPDFKRIIGIGWATTSWGDKPLPTKESLDNLPIDCPIYLISMDGHTIWLNSKGIEELGIKPSDRKNLKSGDMPLNEEGEISGLLMEGEASSPFFLRFFTDFFEDELEDIILTALKSITHKGITSFCDLSPVGLNENRPGGHLIHIFDKVKNLINKNSMPCRMHFVSDLKHVEKGAEVEISAKSEFNNPKLQYLGLKAFADGVLSTYTSYLLQPYYDKLNTKGHLNMDKEIYLEKIKYSNNENLPVRIHATGDAAVHEMLNVFEKVNDLREDNNNNNKHNKNKNIPNSIEHIEILNPKDIPRFRELNVIASMQPAHLIGDLKEKYSRLGKERVKWIYPYGSILKSGATLSFSSDYPIVKIDPLRDITIALTHKDPNNPNLDSNTNQAISLHEILKAYTIGGAHAINRSNELGTIEKGKIADLIIFNCNLFNCSIDEINESKVEMTIVDGSIVYKN